ncbi:MAG: efflux RND transporter permease subunit [Caulobacteraceae bacterium]|nr:efflux RND transporter permease subunit [Caulobacter sp.]
MKFSHFFIDRPVFAWVIAILIMLMGGLAYPTLPIAQYPQIVPPTVTVTAQYPGASAETLQDQVAEPLEEQINGVENMLYMSASSTGDGHMTLTITFAIGTDLNASTVLVQNRIQTALPQLPSQVQQLGLIVRKASPDLLLVVHMYSPDGSLSQQYVANYATLRVLDPLLRVAGVGDITIRGARDYAMRIWIDPNKAAARGLTADDVVNELRAHNVDVAAGTLGAPPFAPGAPPAFQYSVQTVGRLLTQKQFEDIILKTDAQNRITKVSDVARVELGAADYTVNSYLSKNTAVTIPVQQQPGSNAIETAKLVKAKMQELKKDFPAGLDYAIVYNPTDYVQASVDEVEKTLFIALVLVAVVVLVFLQSWRTTIIPLVAIPVSLIGTLAVMKAFGFSLNNLSLFGLVLAIGIVVDDAIVVVENVERNMSEGLGPQEAAHRTMDEVGGALVAIALVLTAVFVPSAFIPGISGQFYRQFALTIAAATLLSLLVSLTLSPAMAALILKPHDPKKRPKPWERPFTGFANGFNKAFAKTSKAYGNLVKRLVRLGVLMVAVYVVLILLTGWRLAATPGGFIPEQDQGTLITVIKMPPGSSLGRTDAVLHQVLNKILAIPGVKATSAYAGIDSSTNATNASYASAYVILNDFAERGKHKDQSTPNILKALRKSVEGFQGAQVRFLNQPPVRGIGTTGGFKMIVEDQGGAGPEALAKAADALVAAANKDPALSGVYTTYDTKTPQIHADIDREKADTLGVPTQSILDTLQTYLGSTFINNFTFLNRTYKVYAQADAPERAQIDDLTQLQARSNSGVMTPLSAVVNVRKDTGPFRTVEYNVYGAAEVNGNPGAGHSSGEALTAMARVAQRTLPQGFGYEWTELAYQQQAAGSTGSLVFVLAVIFAFLLLAALYESVTLPLAVILIVPMCILAAFLGVNLRGMDNNILTQIGLIVLVGLAAKNAILIVEFARQAEQERGEDRWAAAVTAARERLRPILMTSFAFILGVAPLAFAKGAGAELRQALGTAVFFGMIGVTVFGLLFTPVFYVLMRKLSTWLPQPPAIPPVAPTTRGTPEGGYGLGVAE